jgi:hypothetical protein
MLMNNGRHPITNETVVPADVVDHAATGISVSDGKATYPEFVGLPFFPLKMYV